MTTKALNNHKRGTNGSTLLDGRRHLLKKRDCHNGAVQQGALQGRFDVQISQCTLFDPKPSSGAFLLPDGSKGRRGCRIGPKCPYSKMTKNQTIERAIIAKMEALRPQRPQNIYPSTQKRQITDLPLLRPMHPRKVISFADPAEHGPILRPLRLQRLSPFNCKELGTL